MLLTALDSRSYVARIGAAVAAVDTSTPRRFCTSNDMCSSALIILDQDPRSPRRAVVAAAAAAESPRAALGGKK